MIRKQIDELEIRLDKAPVVNTTNVLAYYSNVSEQSKVVPLPVITIDEDQSSSDDDCVVVDVASSDAITKTKLVHVFRVLRKRYGLARGEMLLDPNQCLDSASYFIGVEKGLSFRGPEFLTPIPSFYPNRFRFVTYNVLSQATIGRTMYLYNHLRNPRRAYCLHWEHRSNLLGKELHRFGGSIVCLQEVEEDKFREFFEPMMRRWGCKSFYVDRGDYSDGCAIFWDEAVFTEIERIPIHLNHGVLPLNKPNVAQILILRHKHTGKPLIVVNTHLLFNQKRGDTKLYQLAIIFAHLRKYRTKDEPVIFAGDLNIEPFSPLYKFIFEGSIDCKKNQLFSELLSGQLRFSNKKTRMTTFALPPRVPIQFDCTIKHPPKGQILPEQLSERITHPFRFAPVYDHCGNNEDPEISTFHKDRGCPDHIFYTVDSVGTLRNGDLEVFEDKLHVSRRLSLPLNSFISRIGPMPNEFTGSDHLPLVAEFAFH